MNTKVKDRHTYKLGIVGNCAYLSYIDDKASVQWHCWPQFDSPFIFGALIDKEKGGEFSIQPATAEYESTQYYFKNTNVLVTEFKNSHGEFRVIDFAPRFELFERMHKPLMLFRKIEKIHGNPKVKVICNPTGDFGATKCRPFMGSNSINYRELEGDIRLTTNVSKIYIQNAQPFVLTENKYLVLSYGVPFEAPLESTFEEFLRKTILYWRRWIERSSIPDIYQEEVIRSALILKLHQFEDTGAIIASGTTSLPEHPGSGRNWDYRYCWIRDSYFTLNALNNLSHFLEAEEYAQYLENVAADKTIDFQPVYKIDGTGKIEEKELPLEGYMGNQPVRIGNAAYRQIQNDVYGQIILSLLPLCTDHRIIYKQQEPPLALLKMLLNKMEESIEKPDAGIWEYRNRKQKHCVTSLFHWAGAKAANKIARCYGDALAEKQSGKLIEKAAENIEACYDSNQQCYTMAEGVPHLDASQFLLVTMNYLDHNSEKAINHVTALENQLKTENDLIYRYRDHDDFGETHSTFLVCSFWYAEALTCIGRLDDALLVFERLTTTSNHLGIFSEDICPKDLAQWGNFAQTYSHVGLINTAFRIWTKIDRQAFE